MSSDFLRTLYNLTSPFGVGEGLDLGHILVGGADDNRNGIILLDRASKGHHKSAPTPGHKRFHPGFGETQQTYTNQNDVNFTLAMEEGEAALKATLLRFRLA